MNSLVLRLLLTLTLILCGASAQADDIAADAAAEARPVVLVLGDSLSASYGVPTGQGWVTLLQKRLDAAGYPARVVNASVSGETTAGGLARLPSLIDHHRPRWVLVELGANDGLRGLPLERMRSNLAQILKLSRDAGAQTVLFEMRIPTNYGAEYADGFRRSFATLSETTGSPLIPFFLGAIATDPDAFQDDGLHPTAAAQGKLLDAVWPTFAKALGVPASG